MKKTIIYFDMDDVLVDFYSHPIHKIPRDEYGSPLMYEEGYFRDLKPTAFAIQTFKDIAERPNVEAYILTQALHDHPECWLDKAKWIREYLPEYTNRLIMTCDKNLSLGDILIDDSAKWNTFEGKFIEFTPQSLLTIHNGDERSDEVYQEMWIEVMRQVNYTLNSGNR